MVDKHKKDQTMKSENKGEPHKRQSNRLLKSFTLFACLLLASVSMIHAQTKTVTGTVTDVMNEPLIGVNVTVSGTITGTITDLDGKYTIQVSQGQELVFSYVGMTTQTITVGASNIVDVQMQEDVNLLEETVVIGYGTAKKKDLTGSIVSVDASQIANRPSSNILANLQGRISGVQVVNSGRAGQDPEIRMRGTNSLNGYKPLYVVDGLFTDNISYLNSADIESMEILKDASSLAIFGIAGANGVIIINTKRAKQGETLVNINSSIGFKKINDRVDMANAAQFKELYDEQRLNQGITDPFNYTPWQNDTDWQDEIFQSGLITNNNVSITGSGEKSRFYLGIGYTSEEGSLKSEKFSRVTINLNSDYNVTNFLRFGFQVNGARSLPADAKQVSSALKAAPIASIYGVDPETEETLLHTLPDFQRAQVWNPMIDIITRGRHNKATNYRAGGNIYGEVDLFKDLKFKATLSLDYASNDSRSFSPLIYVYNPDAGGKERLSESESVSQAKSHFLRAMQDYILSYNTKIGKHGINATAGITTNYSEYSGLNAGRSQQYEDIIFSIPNDNPDKWWISSIDPKSMSNGGDQRKRFTMSYLLRGLYNYDNRYLFNASYRRDGSSVFRNQDNTWDNFYSFGAGWVMSEEQFMREQSVIDYLKFKGSWGVLGSENTGGSYYPSYPGLTSAGGSTVFGDNIYTGYTEIYIPLDIRWEKTYSWEVGFEMNLLNSRLRFEPTYYNKETKDILVTTAGVAGAKNAMQNLGRVANKGFEFAGSWSDKIGESGFRYSIGGNFTTIDNEVKAIGLNPEDAQIQGVSRTIAGMPIAYFYGYKVIGIYQNTEHIRRSIPNTLASVQPGDFIFADINGDGLINDKDRTQIGSPTPDYTYGINLNLSYKGFDLGVDLMGVYGNEIYRNWDNSSYAQFNYRTDRLNRWNGEGTSNWEPILDPTRSINLMTSSYYVEDASFIRLKNIQLGYTFQPSILQKLHLKTLRLYANIENLKTWKKVSGYTPEIGGSALQSGIDNGADRAYPVPAIYTFGLNLTF